MSEFVDNFISNHRDFFKRNSAVIKSNKWDDSSYYDKQMDSFSEDLLFVTNKNYEKEKDRLKELDEIKKRIKDFVGQTTKTKESLFKQEHELVKSIFGRLAVFITEADGDRNLEKTQKFIDETAEIINVHIRKCDAYLKYNTDILLKDVNSEEEVEYKSGEIVFQDTVFTSKIDLQEKMGKLNILNTIDGNEIKFFKDKKASLLMKEALELKIDNVKEIVSRIPVDWSLRTSKEMFINMNPRDIPKWNHKKHFFEQEAVILQFWSEEINKINNGVTLNGYWMHPWLYFHLNFFRTPIPQADGSEPNIQPDLRDNEWFMVENLKACVNKNNPAFFDKAMLIYGTRRFAKSVILASLAHWKTITKFNSFGSIIGGTSSDINALTSKIKTSMSYIDKPLQLDILKQEWDNGETTFGIKEDASNPIVFSTLIVQNLENGAMSKTQKTAGLAPSVSIYDEIGKYLFLKPYLAALPSYKTPFGFKCITVLAGTGGEADLSKDAIDVLSNPEAFDLLPMDWDLLESKIDPEHITWKRRKFATFMPGQMAYETGFVKNKQTFAQFLGIEDKELQKIPIHVTNWENNKKLLADEVEKAKQVAGSKGRLLVQQKRVQYPIDPEDCFMSSEQNPFPSEEAKRHRDYIIEQGEDGKKVTLYEDKAGKIQYELSTKELAEFPFDGGFIDAPVVLYEDLPEEKPLDYLYVGGFDDYKQEEAGTSSIGSFHIYKVAIGMDKWCGRIVASIATRPDPHSKLHRQIFLLMKAFNAKCFMENADMDFKEYLDRQRVTEFWLIKSMDFKGDMTVESQGKRKYGWTPTPDNKRFLFSLFVKYCKEEHVINEGQEDEKVILGVELINDVGLLNEIIMYNPDLNVDRITSAMSCLGHEFYLFTNYLLPDVNKLKREIKEQQTIKKSKSMPERMYGTSKPKKMFA